jgi:hypothetical protein
MLNETRIFDDAKGRRGFRQTPGAPNTPSGRLGGVSKGPDPRVTASRVVAGPGDLVGHHIVAVDSVPYQGEEVHIPRLLPGVPEFVAVAEAEEKAEQLRREIFATLTEAKGGRWQSDTTLVVEMRGAAASAVITAAVGLEAFASHHLRNAADPNTAIDVRGRSMTVANIRELSLDERYKHVLPAVLGVKNPAGKPWWQALRRVQGLAALTRHAVDEPVARSGLTDARSLAERYYRGEYVGATRMMFSVFEHFSPNWISDDRLRAIGDGRGSIKEALETLACGRTKPTSTDP